MNRRLISFSLVMAIVVGFGGSVIFASSPETVSPPEYEMEIVDLRDDSIANPQSGIGILKWIAKVLIDAGLGVYNWYEDTVKKNVFNWLTAHVKRDGYIYETYAIGTPECIQVKVRGVVFNHKDKGNWCGDKYSNSYTIVKALQQYLKKTGYDPGTIDGYWGPNTQKAVKKFQEEKGLEVDGIVGKATWEKLVRWK